MSNHLSIVNIIPDNHKDRINELAELLGRGADNLSVKLQDSTGQIYWACHSWWSAENYINFKDTYSLAKNGVDIERYQEAIKNLHEFVINTENMQSDQVDLVPQINKDNALNALGLIEVLPPNQA